MLCSYSETLLTMPLRNGWHTKKSKEKEEEEHKEVVIVLRYDRGHESRRRRPFGDGRSG